MSCPPAAWNTISWACPAGLHLLVRGHRSDPGTGSPAQVGCMDAQVCLIKGQVGHRDPLAPVPYYILCTCQVRAMVTEPSGVRPCGPQFPPSGKRTSFQRKRTAPGEGSVTCKYPSREVGLSPLIVIQLLTTCSKVHLTCGQSSRV